MLFFLIAVVLLVGGGVFVYKARQPDGTFNWGHATAGIAAIAASAVAAFMHFFGNF